MTICYAVWARLMHIPIRLDQVSFSRVITCFPRLPASRILKHLHVHLTLSMHQWFVTWMHLNDVDERWERNPEQGSTAFLILMDAVDSGRRRDYTESFLFPTGANVLSWSSSRFVHTWRSNNRLQSFCKSPTRKYVGPHNVHLKWWHETSGLTLHNSTGNPKAYPVKCRLT